ncbi:MAG: portal protein [Burkholderiales bacterium]
MSYAPETPVVVASANDEVDKGALVAAPDSTTNFADNPDSRMWLEQNVLGLLGTVREDRSVQHEEWGKIRRMANLVKDSTQCYVGQSDAYLPVYKKALETKVSHISRGLFPTDTYIDCVSPDPQFELAAPANKAWMMHQLERAAKIRSELKPFLRSLNNYGLGVAKVWWEKPVNPIKASRLTKLPGIAEMLYNYGEAQPWSTEGARFKARSVFSWYIWPTTVNSIEEASLVFEDIQVSKQFVEDMGKKGIWKNIEQIGQQTNPENQANAIGEQLSEITGSAQTAIDVRQGDLASWVIITECWLRMPVPAKLYQPNEQVGCAVPVKAIFSGGTLIEVRRNPFWHQKPPYVMHRLNEDTDSIYTVGMGRTMQGVQGLINDFINQTNDNGIYGLNPIVKVNPNLIVGNIEPLAPGRMMYLTDPAGMVFDRPPIEQMQYGIMITNQLITYANDMGGSPAVLQGSGAQGGAKTATGSQILQGNVKGELQDLIEDLELRVLMPTMEMIHSLGQQYESAERWLAISGGEKLQFKRDMLLGEFAWKWVASSQAVNQAQRASQSLQFLQAATNPQVMQLLMTQGKMVNPEPLLRRIYEDGLGQRNFDRVVTAAPVGMMGPPQPGAEGKSAEPAPGQAPRSAVEQAPGGTDQMVPGEGEAFGAVRENADDMAAQMGAMGGME